MRIRYVPLIPVTAKKSSHTAFVRPLDKTRTEEEAKSVVARQFAIDYDTAGRNDLYTPQVLFEFNSRLLGPNR